MGELFLAERPGIAGFSKQLVVKRIRPSLAHDENFIEMFLNEGRVAALINHANVVQIYELGEVDGTYFLAMEYVAGKNLEDVLEKLDGPLELGLAIQIILKICEALACAHYVCNAEGAALNLVHRDVSPPNVLLGYGGSVKLTDFGIAKVAQGKQTAVGVLKGKFAYLSPEQARGQTVDCRSDIYSLGLLLFEATTGKRAIPGEMDAEVLYAAANAQTRNPGQALPGYPADLERIFLKATAKRKKNRYQDVAAFRSDLLDFSIRAGITSDASQLGDMLQRLFAQEIAESRENSTWNSTTDVGLSELPTVLPNTSESLLGSSAPDSSFKDATDLADTGQHFAARDGTLSLENSDLLVHDDSVATVEIEKLAENHLSGGYEITTERSVDLPGLFLDDSTDPRVTRPFPPVTRRPQGRAAVANGEDDEDLDESTLAIKERRNWFVALVSRTSVLLGLIVVACGALVALVVGLSGKAAVESNFDLGATDSANVVDVMAATELTRPSHARSIDGSAPGHNGARDATVAATLDVGATPDIGVVAPDRTKVGHLRIQTSPPMVAILGGRVLKRTASMRPGRYSIRLTNRVEGVHLVRKVQIEAGKTTALKVTLGRGQLSVKARPWAHVSVAGIRRGTTPMPVVSLYEGEYRVTLSTDGASPVSKRVRIRKGQTTSLVHRFGQ